jgi:hypothetical protein
MEQDRGAVPENRIEADEGGESACFAHLICPECEVVLDGADHLQWCTWVDPKSGLRPTRHIPTIQ